MTATKNTGRVTNTRFVYELDSGRLTIRHEDNATDPRAGQGQAIDAWCQACHQLGVQRAANSPLHHSDGVVSAAVVDAPDSATDDE